MTYHIVVTSIAKPTTSMKAIAKGALIYDHKFICVGDRKSPKFFDLTGCSFYDLDAQYDLGFRVAIKCPQNKYSRKNIGYLIAIKDGAEIIKETDDDNTPLPDFWAPAHLYLKSRLIYKPGWVNVYSYFTAEKVWPRGFPLELLRNNYNINEFSEDVSNCPVQQGLVNGDPDVDAIYRFTHSLPIYFENSSDIVLDNNTWCPFNSQNTTWWHRAFPLMYLPSYCNIRMSDIWRSFVCQACMWPNGWRLAFHRPTMHQNRNHHNLLKDFSDEIPGYLHNNHIAEILGSLRLHPGPKNLISNMTYCYEALIKQNFICKDELRLLSLWFEDLHDLNIIS